MVALLVDYFSNTALPLNEALLSSSVLKYLHRTAARSLHEYTSASLPPLKLLPPTFVYFSPFTVFFISPLYSVLPLSQILNLPHPQELQNSFLKSNTFHYFPLCPIHTHSQNSDIFPSRSSMVSTLIYSEASQ